VEPSGRTLRPLLQHVSCQSRGRGKLKTRIRTSLGNPICRGVDELRTTQHEIRAEVVLCLERLGSTAVVSEHGFGSGFGQAGRRSKRSEYNTKVLQFYLERAEIRAGKCLTK
jgi:hypothetical protein